MGDTAFPPFQVTQAAVDKIASLGGAVRIDVEAGGCCGTTYRFDVVEAGVTQERRDRRFGCPGAFLFVSERAAEVLPGSTLDYSARVKPPRFRVVRNPNTAEVCACRRSFGSPWPGPGEPACRAYAPMPWDSTYEPPAEWQRQTGYRRS